MCSLLPVWYRSNIEHTTKRDHASAVPPPKKDFSGAPFSAHVAGAANNNKFGEGSRHRELES